MPYATHSYCTQSTINTTCKPAKCRIQICQTQLGRLRRTTFVSLRPADSLRGTHNLHTTRKLHAQPSLLNLSKITICYTTYHQYTTHIPPTFHTHTHTYTLAQIYTYCRNVLCLNKHTYNILGISQNVTFLYYIQYCGTNFVNKDEILI